MNVLAWTVQVLLAAMFTMSGLEKATRPTEKLAGKYPWMREVSPASLRLIGVLEVLGAVGLTVPQATGIAPVLTPVAGAGLAAMMALAAAMHIRRGERSVVPIPAVLSVLAAFVAGVRFA